MPTASAVGTRLEAQKGLTLPALPGKVQAYVGAGVTPTLGVGRVTGAEWTPRQALPQVPMGRTIPAGANPAEFNTWVDAFTREHGGIDPWTYYRGNIEQAWLDKKWGDAYARTHGMTSIPGGPGSVWERKWAAERAAGLPIGAGYALSPAAVDVYGGPYAGWEGPARSYAPYSPAPTGGEDARYIQWLISLLQQQARVGPTYRMGRRGGYMIPTAPMPPSW